MNGESDHNLPVYSVSEISAAVRRVVEDTFAQVRIRGEISGFTRAGSGHLYYALKDENAVIEAVTWKGQTARLGLAPEEGMEVIATGRITTYAQGGRSKYQIVVERLELAGEGALLKLLEARRKKLAAEGLFDEAKKKPIPYLPEVVGVVTSPTGAVIRDILHRIAERFPRRVVLWPVAVQGEGAAAEIAAAIRGFNGLGGKGRVPRPDVIIVARGGGALDDLMAFNDEDVVRAAAASVIPLISAVGHETDTTLIDFAADLRAPTPTAAAERAVPVLAELLERVAELEGRLRRAARRTLEGREKELTSLARALPGMERLVGDASQRLDELLFRFSRALMLGAERRGARLGAVAARLRPPAQRIGAAEARLGAGSRALGRGIDALVREKTRALDGLGTLLNGLSYERALERGFALVTDAKGVRIGRAAKTRPGQGLDIRFFDGRVGVTVSGDAPGGKRKKTPPSDGGQGSLL